MSDDALKAIRAKIGDHWAQMIQNSYTPALVERDEIHRLAPEGDSEIDCRDIGIYDAGVLRGLELAAAAAKDAEEQ